MRAVVNPSAGVLALADRPPPAPADREILVRVHAAGLNRADLLQRDGRYPAPPGWPPDIPGLEYAGEVTALGSGASRWRIGDRVMGLAGGGAQAELIAVHEAEAIAIPAGMEYPDAAAIPEAFITAWDAIAHSARAERGDRLLVHAAGSGVGTAAIQIGRLIGTVVIGTSRSAAKLDRCRALGLDIAIDTTAPDWDRHVDPVQVILDTLGAAYFAANIRLLAPRGRMVILGTITGAQTDGLDLGRMIRSRLEIVGTAMRSRRHPERASLAEQFSKEMLPRFADGSLVPVVDRVMPMSAIDDAHALMRANTTFGKIVLTWE